MRPRQFSHRRVIPFDLFQTLRTGVASNVVSPRKNDNHLRTKLNHVRPQSNKQLRRGLSADPAVDVGLARKRYVKLPQIGDGVAKKHDAVLASRRRLESSIGIAV